MRVAIISDIHANREAFEAVLEDSVSRSIEGWWFLGDAVGYGGDPEAVVERLRSLRPFAAVRGNHDKVVASVEEPDGFSELARRAALRTRELITDETRAYLASLSRGPIPVSETVSLCHGSWMDEDFYLLWKHDIERTLDRMPASLLFFGHTHRATLYAQWNGSTVEVPFENDVPLSLIPKARYLANPGSVGQPRDRDPRAAYAILDTERWELTFFRVPYDVAGAQARIREAGLPELNAIRLPEGR